MVVPGPTRASVSFSIWVSMSPASCVLLGRFYTTGEGKGPTGISASPTPAHRMRRPTWVTSRASYPYPSVR